MTIEEKYRFRDLKVLDAMASFCLELGGLDNPKDVDMLH